MVNFFSNDLKTEDPQVAKILELESKRQNDEIGLIASENLVSKAVLEAQGSDLTNKYAEGYPRRRYYGGCEQVDKVEALAIDRAKQLFEAKFVNVQPHSGSQANATVYLALLKPGDTILGMSLDAGGHLTHGAKPSFSGKWFNSVQYGIDPQSHLIDYEQVHRLALEHKPRMIIAGVSSYSRIIDFRRFREIADEIGAYLMVDMAHFAGLVVANQYENPIDYADVVTTTTHKTLRGPRGGMILSNNESLFKKLNSALFPGIQGGPLMHVVAAKAVCFKEALQPEFQEYGKNVVKNCKAMATTLQEEGFDIVSGGTDTHLLVLDLRRQQLSGKDAEKTLINARITCNKNAVPSDPKPPTVTSGIRLGSLICTTRGFSEKEFTQTAKLIAKVLNGLKVNGIENNHLVEQEVAKEVGQLLSNFPI